MQKTAFVFPGQGSQALGMLDAFLPLPVVRETLALAAQVLKRDLLSLITHGPKEVLDDTQNTQPIMLAAGIAIYRAFLQAGGKAPALLAGHSLGEYTALVAANVLSLEDALPLVSFRAKVMQEAVPRGVGGMAAILGLSGEAVCALCAEITKDHTGVLEAVNFNTPEQTVIAGHKHLIALACDLARKKGAKRALVLPVSAPFHSSLLHPASARLAEYFSAMPAWAAPEIPIVSNIDAQIHPGPEALQKALIQQADHPVQWLSCMHTLKEQGVTHLVECGPGKVLAGLARRIHPNWSIIALTDTTALEQVLSF